MANTYEELMAKSREMNAAGDVDGARRVAKIAIGRRAPPQPSPAITSDQRTAISDMPYQNTIAGTAGQFGAGSQTGIAQAAGFPVDAITGGINGLGALTGAWGPIEKPFGGSASIEAMLSPFREGIGAPQTATERVARRVGQEVGASTTMLPAGLALTAGRAAPGAVAVTEGASALGSGSAAAAANELAPGNPYADILASIAGGSFAGGLMGKATGLGGSKAQIIPGMEDQRNRAADAYGAVKADRRTLPQTGVNGTEDMALGLSQKMDDQGIYQPLQPGSSAIRDLALRDASKPMRIEDVENLRRMTTQGLSATAPPADGRLAGIMKDDITAYLDNLGDPIADRLKDGRDAHRRGSAAQTVADASTKAARRAASTGSGGNEINAMRQNLRSIIDSPRKARSFTTKERAAIEEIVRGTTEQNVMRRASRFAPSSGGLSAMMGIGGAMASPGLALPIMAATEAAKYLGESSTRKSIAALLQSLAPDKMMKPGDAGSLGIIGALLAGRTVAQQP